ncbi:hypothetical protein [Fodinibius sp.]|uniref:hypothetical protein n=1 Tax=Fodinibius sp. TaxID=1872440 RepID=UPI002ACEAA99|nr:hypothetical protein [Fodinibius sp.]MDZ7658048.1 hypothetical protein [Fodinibius sp.]
MESTKQIDNHKATVHKTDHYTQEQLEELQEKADGQEKDLARYFWKHPFGRFSPSQLHRNCEFIDWPLTSTRRALTNLTNDDILVKTEYTVEGKYGRDEHQWRWKRPADFKVEPKQGDMFGTPKSQNKGPYAEV